MKFYSLLLLCIIYLQGFSQDISKDSVYKLVSDKTFDKLSQSYKSLDKSVNQQIIEILNRFQKQELKLKNMLQKKDSSKAQQLFSNSEATFAMMNSKLQEPLETSTISSLMNYVPGLDSVKTALQFLNKSGLSVPRSQKATALLAQIKQLQASLQNANSIKDYLSQREANLQIELNQFGLNKQLVGINQKVFYYQQQISQYKDVLNNQQKQQEIIITAVTAIPSFAKFWQSNSGLSQLFPMPGNTETVLAGAGLQTSRQIGKNIQQRLGTNLDNGGTNASQFLQQQIGNGQGEVDQLKDKLNKLNLNSGNSAMALPDFTPAFTNRKSLFDRLKLGFNIQNNNSTNFLPTIIGRNALLPFRVDHGWHQ